MADVRRLFPETFTATAFILQRQFHLGIAIISCFQQHVVLQQENKMCTTFGQGRSRRKLTLHERYI